MDIDSRQNQEANQTTKARPVMLFVYGTLRQPFELPLMKQLSGYMLLIGQGKINASLYDLGSYPAAVQCCGSSEVRGDLYSVMNASFVFSLLDDYEGQDYRRSITPVQMAEGEEQQAWVYWYTGSTGVLAPIIENDYIDYLKNKKDRFV